MYTPNKINVVSGSRIILSAHSKERAMERLNITKVDELRNMAARARNKGICHTAVNLHNYQRLGLTYREYCSFVCSIKKRSNSERVYLYKDYVWVFRGQKALNLVTVFKMNVLDRVPEQMGELRKNENKIGE